MQRIVVAVALVTLAWGVPAAPAGAADATIDMAGTQFVPQFAQVSTDGKVTFVNMEAANYPAVIGNHNVVPDEVVGALPGNQPFPTSSDLIKPGESWACDAGPNGPLCTGIDGNKVELKPGRYAFMCGIHPNQMHAVLEVV
jgi:plastocyanin